MKTTFCFIIASINLLICFSAFAQENEKPIIVSPLIGDTLSLKESDYYNMFSTIENFQRAVFYLNPDSTLRAEVTYLNDRIPRGTIVYIDKKVESLRFYIDARDNIGTAVQQRADNDKGSEIILIEKNGMETTGNLLAVRQSSVLLYNQDCNDEVIDINCVNKFNGSEIQKVVIPGKSNVALGVGIGLLLGTAVAVAGIISGNESSDPLNEGIAVGITAFALGVSIAAAGTIIGIVTSTPDKVIEPFSGNDIKGLSAYSRYPQGEPDLLKEIK